MVFATCPDHPQRERNGRHVPQEVILVHAGHVNEKCNLLYEIFAKSPPCWTVIFAADARNAEYVWEFVRHHHLPVSLIHGNRTHVENRQQLQAFRCGDKPILIVGENFGEDALGGIVPLRDDIAHVIHFDCPNDGYRERRRAELTSGSIGYITIFCPGRS